MIKSDKGNVEVNGPRAEVLADLSMIVSSFKTNTNFTDDEIRNAVEVGLMPEAERNEKMLSIIKESGIAGIVIMGILRGNTDEKPQKEES